MRPLLALATLCVLGVPSARAADDDAPDDGAVAEEETERTVDVPAAPPPRVRNKPEVSASFTDDFEFRYWMTPAFQYEGTRLEGFEDSRALDYIEIVNRFTANVRSGRFGMYAQLDLVALGDNSYFLDDVRYLERDLMAPDVWSVLLPGRYDPASQGTEGWDLFARNTFVTLEKLRFTYDEGPISLALGDSYVAFGRGLALNLNRNVDIDIDTSLQGVTFLWRPGAWDITAIFGQLNRQQVFQDNPNRGILGERRHTVGGLRIERFGLGPVNLGAHGVVYDFTDEVGWEAGFDEIETGPDVVVAGGTVEAFGLGPTDWYVEADGYFFPTDDAFAGADARPGYGIYASGVGYFGPTILTAEFKRYKDAERLNQLLVNEQYEVAIAPTLEYERAITEDSGTTVNSNDIWGGRLRLDWTAVPAELVPYAALAVYRDLDLGGGSFNSVPETVWHPVLGVDFTRNRWSVLANVGYRIDDRDGEAFGFDRQLHGDILARFPLPKGWAIDLSIGAEYFQWGVNVPVQQSDYVEVESAVGFQFRRWVTVVWYTDFSSNPIIDSVGNLTRTVYGAGEVIVKPLPSLTVRAFFGAYKSGIRCSGGQCRVLPGFEGGRLSVTAAF